MNDFLRKQLTEGDDVVFVGSNGILRKGTIKTFNRSIVVIKWAGHGYVEKHCKNVIKYTKTRGKNNDNTTSTKENQATYA